MNIKILLALLALPHLLWAGELDIEYPIDTAYLPYRYVHEFGIEFRNFRPVINPVHLYSLRPDSTGKSYLITVRNRILNNANPAIVSFISYPDCKVIDDDPIRMIINDCILHSEPLINTKSLIGVGYDRDSAWAFKLFPESDSLSKSLLTIGKDGDGDGLWSPTLTITLVDDYDFDGISELFVFLSSERELTPRHLFCLNTNDLSIEWRIEVSPTVYRMFSCRDSINPSVIFVTANPMQGVTDRNYSDRYSYMSRVNYRGEILFNRIISVTPERAKLIEAEEPGYYFLTHPIPLTDPARVAWLEQTDSLATLSVSKHYISKIDNSGRVVFSVQTENSIIQPTLFDLDADGSPELLVQYANGVIKSFTTSLELIAESPPRPLVYSPELNNIDLVDHANTWVFQDGIYTAKLEQLLSFPRPYNHLLPLEYDQDSNVVRVMLSATNSFSCGRIEKKSTLELLSAFYHTNQIYILMIMSGSLVGLVVMNYYRTRARGNLKLITEQKEQLEETHRKLKEAQKTILAQEKYRQAKDIAGGFAHEIRNALSPARNALCKLIEDSGATRNSPQMVQKLSRFSDSAIERAIRLTSAISDYTRLEDLRTPESVRLGDIIEKTIDLNQHRIDRQSVRIDVSIEEDSYVESNAEQLMMVFNNLFLNSLDALTDSSDPNILIRSHPHEDFTAVDFTDNGSGIDGDKIERIFDMFYSTKPDRGTGIGLTLSRKILELYGGSIAVTSKPGEDTSFRILLRGVRE